MVLHDREQQHPQQTRGGRITPHQGHILDLMCAGLTNRQIAEEAGIARSTVRTHLRKAYATLGAQNRAHAARLWPRMRPARLSTLPLPLPSACPP